MGFYNRRLLSLNEDVPISTSTFISPFPQIQPNRSSPSISITPSSSPPSKHPHHLYNYNYHFIQFSHPT
ncbi:RING-type E3 ubiquitin transferase [Trifolium repens]|nr:RING-type E3 ubiquitin transferase [Trifolium repens]